MKNENGSRLLDNDDENLVTEYRSWKEEERLINEAIINEVREKSINEGLTQGIAQNRKEMVLNLYSKNLPISLISEYVLLSEEEVKKIIDDNK